MSTDGDILELFDEMLLVEKQLSNNTRRAYKSDINLYIKFIHAKYNFSILLNSFSKNLLNTASFIILSTLGLDVFLLF